MNKKFNPEMLRLARDLREMTQADLAKRVGVGQAFISRVEGGDKEPSDTTLESLSVALSFPTSFFGLQETYSGVGLSLVYYRKRASALETHLRRLQAEVALRRIQIGLFLRGVNIAPTDRTFQMMDIDEYGGDVERVASLVRASWSLPIGPISNLVGVIESAGGIVFKFPFGTRDIDAVSQWPDQLPPLFFINSEAPMDRVRFSLAHEMGHVIMHASATDEMEREADRFAAEFLVPAREAKPQLRDITLQRAAALKPYWRVSMAALIYRARDLEQIPEDEYRRLFKELSRLGYRKNEPLPLTPENPRALRQILDVYQVTNGFSVDELARLANVYEPDFSARMLRSELGKGELRLA